MAKIEIKHKGRTLSVYTNAHTKDGVDYTSYQVPDYSTGKRKLWTFSDLPEAKAKAKEIADGCAAGQQGVLALAPLQHKIESALAALKPTGTHIDRAAAIVADALKLIPEDEILAACRHWRDSGPGQRFTPRLTSEALADFNARREGKISSRRRKTERSYLNTFGQKFGPRFLHEVTGVEIGDFASAKRWAKKTRNDWLGAVSLFLADAVSRGWAKVNPVEAVKREKLRGGAVEILTPDQGRAILNLIGDELKAGLALWCFSGMRISEIARLTWPEVDAGLKSGSIYLRETKNGPARPVAIPDNLRVWLMRYRKAEGTVMRLKWTTEAGLSQLAKHIRRKTKVWVANGPRHSFGTFHLKLHGDPALTVRLMGSSLDKLQRNYASRSEAVTKEAAQEWFDIVPAEENVIPMPAAVQATVVT